MSRSKRLPFVATRIVYACSALTMTERALWCQHYGLDNKADGCILGASNMARRLAISRDWVEQLRRRFLDLGLLNARQRGRRRRFCSARCRWLAWKAANVGEFEASAKTQLGGGASPRPREWA